MRSLIIITLLFGIYFQIQGQNQTIVDRIFSAKGKNYTIKVVKISENGFQINLEGGADKKSSFTVRPLRYDPFLNGMRNEFPKVTIDTFTNEEIDEVSSNLFFQVAIEKLDIDNSSPQAGELKVHENANLYYGNSFGKFDVVGNGDKIKIKSVHIEFNDGFIQNIIVYADVKEEIILASKKTNSRSDKNSDDKIAANTELKFENSYPIGFSTSFSYGELSKIYLMEKNLALDVSVSLRLSEVISYKQALGLNRRDYSPKNEVLDFIPPETRKLYKEPTNKLFELKVFSDFVGFDSNTPNGLVQTTLAKKFNIWTGRHRLSPKYGTNLGFFNSFTPSVTISKIEDNNRTLELESDQQLIAGELLEDLHADPLRIRQFQNFNLDLNASLVQFEIPTLKIQFNVDAGVRFGSTALLDSIQGVQGDTLIINTDDIHSFSSSTIESYTSLSCQFLPEERYGLNVKYEWIRFTSLSDEFNQRIPVDEENLKNNRLNMLEAEAFFSPNDGNKLFFRYRIFTTRDYWNNNFYQAQLGYSFYFKNRRN